MENQMFNYSGETPEERRLREQRELEALMEQARYKKHLTKAGVAGSGARTLGDVIGTAIIGIAKIGNV